MNTGNTVVSPIAPFSPYKHNLEKVNSIFITSPLLFVTILYSIIVLLPVLVYVNMFSCGQSGYRSFIFVSTKLGFLCHSSKPNTFL